MCPRSPWPLLPGLFFAALAFAQPALRLKLQPVPSGELEGIALVSSGHQVIQFDDPPGEETVSALAARGLRVLGDVPDNGLLISVNDGGTMDLAELGVRYVTRLRAGDKLSPMAVAAEDLIVEFHSDVEAATARALILNLGLELRENPDLAPAHLMIHAPVEGAAWVLRRLAGRDEVAYIFPASDELIRGRFVVACAGALTSNGMAGQYIATYGDGWDGPGRNAATLGYVFGPMTAKLPSGSAQSEIQKAMKEWAKVIQLTWQPGTNAAAARTLHILFGAGAHGDNYPFDGPGRVLAHTFYPAPPNPEPIAGDMHLDGDESWRMGANIDVFSVALHELGHALGLGHSDNPGDVMYPYYRLVSALASGDKTAILTLYAAAGSGGTAPPPPPAPGPLTLTVNVPPATTTVAAISLSGTVSGGTTAPSVTWTSSTGAWGLAAVSGGNWSVASVPLAMGVNSITITASSGATQVARTVTVTRQEPTGPASPDTTPPSLTITSARTTSGGASVTLTGVASDNAGVTRVVWSTNTGLGGTAAGATSWSASVPLLVGNNSITVRAFDAAGNSAWRSVVVTRR